MITVGTYEALKTNSEVMGVGLQKISEIHCVVGVREEKNLRVLAEVMGGEGSEGAPGAQPVNGHYLEIA